MRQVNNMNEENNSAVESAGKDAEERKQKKQEGKPSC